MDCQVPSLYQKGMRQTRENSRCCWQEKLDKARRRRHTGAGVKGGRNMNIIWMINTNTLLLVILIMMVSYLTVQMNAIIRFLRRD